MAVPQVSVNWWLQCTIYSRFHFHLYSRTCFFTVKVQPCLQNAPAHVHVLCLDYVILDKHTHTLTRTSHIHITTLHVHFDNIAHYTNSCCWVIPAMVYIETSPPWWTLGSIDPASSSSHSEHFELMVIAHFPLTHSLCLLSTPGIDGDRWAGGIHF